MTIQLKTKIITAVMIILNLANIAFWTLSLYPFKVVDVQSVEILTPVVKPGEQVRYRVTGCKYFAVAAEAQRKLVDHYEYFLSKETVNDLSTGCFTKEMSIPVPAWAENDTYKVHIDLTHTIFGFRKIDTHYETPEFIVKR